MTALLDVKNIIYNTLVNEFKSRSIDVSISREYPKSIQVLKDKPCISIARASGAEEIMMVSDLVSEASVGDSQFIQSLGYLNQEIYEISIWTLLSLARDNLIILTRQILFENRLKLDSQGFQKMILVGCSDEEVDTSKVPAIIYRGVLRYMIMSKVSNQSTDDLVEAIVPNLLLYPQQVQNMIQNGG
jgi:hypothetical protein